MLHHPLVEEMVIAVCTVLFGAETWTEIEEFGDSK